MEFFNLLLRAFTFRGLFKFFSFVSIACFVSGCQEANVSNEGGSKAAPPPELPVSSKQGVSNEEVLKKLEEFGRELGKINEIREELTVIQDQLNATSDDFIDPSPVSNSAQSDVVQKGDSNLFDASAIGDNLRVKELLAQGVDANSKDENGQAALHHAAANARSGIVRLLIDAGAKVNQPDGEKLMPLNHAYFTNDEETIEVLLKNNATAAKVPDPEPEINPDTAQEDLKASVGEEALGAVLKDDPELLGKLVSQGLDLGSLVSGGQTALNAAINNDSIKIVKYLFEKHPGQVKLSGNSGVMMETLNSIYEDPANATPNKKAIVKLLIKEFSGSINELKNEFAPLHTAISNQDLDLLQFLLKEGANIELEGPQGITPLIMAILVSDHVHGHEGSHSASNHEHETGHGHQLEMVELLLKSGADVHKKAMIGRDAIIESIRHRREDITRILLQFGANPKSADDNGVTCLHYAAYSGQSDICKILLTKGAKRDAVVLKGSKKGLKPIDAARDGKHRDIVSLLEKEAK